MNYRLVPRPRGYYAECGAGIEPSLEADLQLLLSGDDHAIDHAQGWSVRSEVLVERIEHVVEANAS